jgi:Zn-dependent peptidase ImmA (M78 family)
MNSSKVKTLIINECASYERKGHGIHHYCCHEPGNTKQCIYFVEDNEQRCSRFESAVLPLEPETAALYYAELKANAEGYELTKYQRKLVVDANKIECKCSTCGKVFNPASRRQKNCEYCRKQRIRDQARIRKQNQRQGA